MKYAPCRFGRVSIAVVLGAMLFAPVVFAQTTPSDIPQDLQSLASELGCTTRVTCEATFNANLSRGIDLAERYQVYDAAERRIAQSFKEEVLQKLTGVSEAEFEERIIAIAKNLVRSKPALARQLDVTSAEVNAAETIVTEVRNAGVDLNVCSRSANSLSREQLVACLNASRNLAQKTDAVKIYLSTEQLEHASEAGRILELETAVTNGEYAALGKTTDEIGVACLRPGSPAACDEIARRFFGEEGVQELARARTQVGKSDEYYRNSIGSYTLTTSDGKTITGKDSIRNACDQAFRTRNVTLARSCGEFAVRNGFAEQEDIEEGLSILESVADRQDFDFDRCRQNPESCQEFLPQEYRREFETGRQAQEIMAAEIGFDPRQCEQGGSNPEIGQRCYEGAERALPKLRALNTPESQRIVEDIERHLEEGKRFSGAPNDQFQQAVAQGGPGGCKSHEECFAFCSNPANGTECLSFGAKQGVFRGNDTVERFERYNERYSQSFAPPIGGQYPQGQGSQFPGQATGPYPGFQPPGQGGQSPGQQQGFTYPGPGFGGPGVPGSGPSPECMSAIQSGNFARAKELCQVQGNPYQGTQYPPGSGPGYSCPATSYPAPCPPGQYRRQQILNGCPVFDACTAESSVGEGDHGPLCPAVVYPECPVGQYHPIGVGGCPELRCVPSGGTGTPPPPPGTTSPQCDWATQYFKSSTNSCAPRSNCTTTSHPDYSSSECQGVRNTTGGGGGGSSTMQRCFYSNASVNGRYPGYTVWCERDYYNCHEGSPSGASISLTGLSLGAPSSCEYGWPGTNPGSSCPSGQYWNGTACVNSTSPSGQVNQVWNSFGLQSQIRTDADPARIEQLKQACANVRSGSNIWMSGAGTYTSPDFGMPDPEKCRIAASCTAEQYFNGSSCGSGGSGGSCPSGQYWYTPPSGGAGYCSTSASSCDNTLTSLLGSGCHTMSDGNYYNSEMTRYVVPGSTTVRECSSQPSSGCSGGGSGSVCESNATQASCTSSAGCLWSGTYCYYSSAGGGGCGSYSTQTSCTSVSGCTWAGTYCYSGGSGSTCPSGQYWYVPPSGGSGYCTSSNTSSTGSTSCGTGYYWNGSSCVTTCPSGQYWNGSACVNTSTTDCPSGQYWNGTSCVSNTTTTTCPSGQYWNGSACVNSTTTTTCPSGQYWDGSACVTSTHTPPPSTSPPPSYNSDPATACAQAGGTWSSSTNYCQMPGSFLNPNPTMAQISSILSRMAEILRELMGR